MFDTVMTTPAIDISVVLPVHNEADNLEPLYDELLAALGALDASWEILAINDGSRDDSLAILQAIAGRHTDKRLRIIDFTRNFGQTAALACGFHQARGRIIIPMDADRQNDPHDIPRLLAEMDKGYDVISGWRKNRRDNPVRTIPSRVANRLINKLIRSTGVALHDYGCTLKAYRADILKNLHLYGEMHRFIPAFAGWRGARVGELAVNHRARTAGVSKYGMGRIWKVIMDLIAIRFFTDHLTKPMQFFGKYALYLLGAMGISLAGLGLCDLAGLAGIDFNSYLFTGGIFLLAVQNLLGIGLVAEVVVRHYFEAAGGKAYVIRKEIRHGED